jgi:hypothetical protein
MKRLRPFCFGSVPVRAMSINTSARAANVHHVFTPLMT